MKNFLIATTLILSGAAAANPKTEETRKPAQAETQADKIKRVSRLVMANAAVSGFVAGFTRNTPVKCRQDLEGNNFVGVPNSAGAEQFTIELMCKSPGSFGGQQILISGYVNGDHVGLKKLELPAGLEGG